MRLIAEDEQSVGIRDSDPRRGKERVTQTETAWGLDDGIRERAPETPTEDSILKTQIEIGNESPCAI
jgi:hypothetical protein